MAHRYPHRRSSYRATDQTEGFADCGRRSVENLTEWFTENPAATSDRFVTVERGAYQTEKVTRWVDTRYTLTSRKSFNSQADCMAAWENMEFPTHNLSYDRTHGVVAELYSSENFRAYQHPDGTGRVEHYSTDAAIRTRAGTVFNNSQDYGTGFATLTPAQDAVGSVPLDTIESAGVLPHGLDKYDLHDYTAASRLSVHSDGEIWDRSATPELITFRRTPEFSDAGGLVIVSDPSSKNHNENTAMFAVTRAEIDAADTVADLETVLVPDAVAESGLDVVPTNQMVPNSQYVRRAEYHTSRYDDRGDVVQRQGEWFFVPVEDLGETARGGLSHVEGVVSECAGCGATRFDVDDHATTCKACGHRHMTDYESGTDVMGSHTPTDYLPAGNSTAGPSHAVADGGEPNDESDESDDTDESSDEIAGYVRGTVRHTDDHYMARLGETWHLAVTHGRDVVVVDTSTPGHRRERGRSMRWD